MKKYVIDSNILFSAIISSKRIYLEIVKVLDLYAPDFALKEMEKYEEVIIKKTKIDQKDMNTFLMKLFQGVTILPSLFVDKQTKEKAFILCKDIDEKDTPFVALSIELGVPLITNDKKLFKGLIAKGFTDILLLEDVMKDV